MRSEAIVDRIDTFVNLLPQKLYDRPGRKFIRELIAGMMMAQSTVLTRIVRTLVSSNREFKAAYKRLDRRLGEVDLAEAKTQQQARALREIKDDTIIAIDLGDFTKPYAKTMECLAPVADGSDGHQVKPGYWLLGIVAVDPWQKDKTPSPLELNLYSAESEEFVSENDVLLKAIRDLHFRTQGKGIHVIDRGGDRGMILRDYMEMKTKFIIRMNDRYLTTAEGVKIRTRTRQIHRDSLPFAVDLQRESDIHDRPRKVISLRFDFEPVKVTALAKKTEHACWLVTAWGQTSKTPLQLLTSIPVCNAADAIRVIMGYFARWSVEETYRFFKAGEGLEEMRYLTYGRLQNITRAMFIVVSLMARMAKSSSWRAVFARQALRLKKSPDELYNWLYLAGDACAALLSKFRAALLAANAPIFHRRRPALFQPLLFSEEGQV